MAGCDRCFQLRYHQRQHVPWCSMDFVLRVEVWAQASLAKGMITGRWKQSWGIAISSPPQPSWGCMRWWECLPWSCQFINSWNPGVACQHKSGCAVGVTGAHCHACMQLSCWWASEFLHCKSRSCGSLKDPWLYERSLIQRTVTVIYISSTVASSIGLDGECGGECWCQQSRWCIHGRNKRARMRLQVAHSAFDILIISIHGNFMRKRGLLSIVTWPWRFSSV